MSMQQKGEGNYEAAAEFQDAQHAFAKSGKVAEKAKEAADAFEGSEADKLEQARTAAAQGHSA